MKSGKPFISSTSPSPHFQQAPLSSTTSALRQTSTGGIITTPETTINDKEKGKLNQEPKSSSKKIMPKSPSEFPQQQFIQRDVGSSIPARRTQPSRNLQPRAPPINPLQSKTSATKIRSKPNKSVTYDPSPLLIPNSSKPRAKSVEQDDTQFMSPLVGQKRKRFKQGCSVLPPSTESILKKLQLPKGAQAQYKKIVDKPIVP